MGSTKAGLSTVTWFLCCLLAIATLSESVTAQPSNTSIDAILPPSLVITASNVHLQKWLFGVVQQIYTFNGSAWLLTNVSADLYGSRGIKVGHHFFLGELDSNGGRATWITFNPPTRVSGKTLVSVPSPFPISGVPKDSIPWLLVQATSNNGTQKFLGSTTYVQRYSHMVALLLLEFLRAQETYSDPTTPPCINSRTTPPQQQEAWALSTTEPLNSHKAHRSADDHGCYPVQAASIAFENNLPGLGIVRHFSSTFVWKWRRS